MWTLIFLTLTTNGLAPSGGNPDHFTTGPIFEDKKACTDAGDAVVDLAVRWNNGGPTKIGTMYVCAPTKSGQPS